MSNDLLIDQIKQLQPNEVNELFHQFVKDNHFKSVETLSKLIDINIPNNDHEPALYHTIINKQWKMAQLLIENKAQLNNNDAGDNNWSEESKQVITDIIHFAIRDHNIDESFIDFLLSQHSKITHIEHPDQYGYTPILTAALYGNVRILKHLVGKYTPNVHHLPKNGHNLYHCAILSKEKCTIELLNVINLLGVDINTIDNGSNHLKRMASPLTYAIYDGLSFDIIQKLVELGADIITTNDLQYNQFGDNFATPKVQSHLFTALLYNDDYQLFKYLIESCQSPKIPFKSLLKRLFEKHNFELVKFIIEKHRIKFDQDTYKIDLFQIIFDPCDVVEDIYEDEQFPHYVDMIEYLLLQNVHGCFDFGIIETNFISESTALLIFAECPQSTLQLLQLMVQNGADIHAIDENGDGVLQLLCCSKEEDTYIEKNAENCITKLDYFISLGVNVNPNIDERYNKKVMSALHYAVGNEVLAPLLVPHLIQHHNADITLINDVDAIPLHYILHPELVPLLSTPAIINHKNKFGATPLLLSLSHPLWFGSQQHYFGVVSNLLQCGADGNIADQNGLCPIHQLFTPSNFQHQPIDVIKLVIQQPNINLNVVHNFVSPLQQAIGRFFDSSKRYQNISKCKETRLNAIQSIKLLLQYNADIRIHGIGIGCGINHVNNVSNGSSSCNNTILHYICGHQFNSDPSNSINDDLVEELMDVIMDGIIDQVIMNSNDINKD